MGLGRFFGRGKDEDEGLGIPGAGEGPISPSPVGPRPASGQVHVTSQTFDVSDDPQAVDAVMDLLKAQGIDISQLTGGTTIEMGQPMDPQDAERLRQHMLGMLGSMGIDATGAPGPLPGIQPADDGIDDVVASLERLVKLRDAGALTQAEFEAQKARILRG